MYYLLTKQLIMSTNDLLQNILLGDEHPDKLHDVLEELLPKNNDSPFRYYIDEEKYETTKQNLIKLLPNSIRGEYIDSDGNSKKIMSLITYSHFLDMLKACIEVDADFQKNFKPDNYPIKNVGPKFEDIPVQLFTEKTFYNRYEVPITINKEIYGYTASPHSMDILEGFIFYDNDVTEITIDFLGKSKTFKIIDNKFLPKNFYIPFPNPYTPVIFKINNTSPVKCGLICGLINGLPNNWLLDYFHNKDIVRKIDLNYGSESNTLLFGYGMVTWKESTILEFNLL